MILPSFAKRKRGQIQRFLKSVFLIINDMRIFFKGKFSGQHLPSVRKQEIADITILL